MQRMTVDEVNAFIAANNFVTLQAELNLLLADEQEIVARKKAVTNRQVMYKINEELLAVQIPKNLLKNAIKEKKAATTPEEAYAYLLEMMQKYEKNPDYNHDLMVAARELAFAYRDQKRKGKRPAAEVLIAAGDILDNNSVENREKFAALCDKYENKNHKYCRFMGAALMFLGVACLAGAIALGCTGVGALPALFMIVGSVCLLSLGLYTLAICERKRTEAAMLEFNSAATPWFFKRWFEKKDAPTVQPKAGVI